MKKSHILLVCTVGGTPAPVVAAIKGCEPDRIIFIVSQQTSQEVPEQIVPLLTKEGVSLSPGQYKIVAVPDAQDFVECVERIQEIEPEVREWLARGSDFGVVVDLTGGTKCMSASLALVARRWPCLFSYVGGTERSKGGVGVVIDGKESVYHTQNPWDVLGYQTAEEAITLFDKGDYRAAVDVLDHALQRMENAAAKSELASLKLLAEGYLAWDLFAHAEAKQQLKAVEKNINNLCHLTGGRHQDMKQIIRSHLDFLENLQGNQWNRYTIIDLLANSQRCAQRGRYDDAVARVYRAIEATAQLQLRDHYDIPDTGKIPLEKIPEPLLSKWKSRAKDGLLQLSLQDDYQLLKELGDELGKRFHELNLSGENSPLNIRNRSILAHGFTPVAEKVFQDLYSKAMSLAQIQEDHLPRFCTLNAI